VRVSVAGGVGEEEGAHRSMRMLPSELAKSTARIIFSGLGSGGAGGGGGSKRREARSSSRRKEATAGNNLAVGRSRSHDGLAI
jgi:hypothetical protein